MPGRCYHPGRVRQLRKSSMTDLELLARVLLSQVFGLIVGVERQWHHKNAGIKTNTLVAVGSTAFALISARGFGATNNPAAVAAGVVTGIGFIGAGVIRSEEHTSELQSRLQLVCR